MSFVIITKKDPKKLQNLWAPSLTTVHISLVGWDQGALLKYRYEISIVDISTLLKNIDIDIDIDMEKLKISISISISIGQF